jgi:hypothetical protein
MRPYSLPGQFSLFATGQLPPPRDHDPTGLTLREIAAWTFQNGVGVLTGPERAFLYEFTRVGGGLSGKRLLELSNLHLRVGGRPIDEHVDEGARHGFVSGHAVGDRKRRMDGRLDGRPR